MRDLQPDDEVTYEYIRFVVAIDDPPQLLRVPAVILAFDTTVLAVDGRGETRSLVASRFAGAGFRLESRPQVESIFTEAPPVVSGIYCQLGSTLQLRWEAMEQPLAEIDLDPEKSGQEFSRERITSFGGIVLITGDGVEADGTAVTYDLEAAAANGTLFSGILPLAAN